MSNEQFLRLADCFWKTSTADQRKRTWQHYREALNDLPPEALDRAIAKSIKTCTRMPFPVQLRDWAVESMPRSTSRRVEHEGPCRYCAARIAGTVDPATGKAGRQYMWHEPHCPQPSFLKPAHLEWAGSPAALLAAPAQIEAPL